MKHPALTRALAAALAVFCLVTLLAGGGSLWKTRGDRSEYLRQQQRFRDRIDRTAALDQSLKSKERRYEASSEDLEARLEAHEKAAEDYRGRLATYTATRAGVKMGREALEQASNLLWKNKRYYEDGLAEFQKGAAAFEQIYRLYLSAASAVQRTRVLYQQGRALLDEDRSEELMEQLPPETVLSTVAATHAGIVALRDVLRRSDGQMQTGDAADSLRQLEQVMSSLSERLGGADSKTLAARAVEQILAQSDALIAERVAQGVSEEAAVAEADAVTQAALGMSYGEARDWLAGNVDEISRTQDAFESFSEMDPEQIAMLLDSLGGEESLPDQLMTVLDEEEAALAAQEAKMLANPASMNSAEELLTLLDTAAGSGERVIGILSGAMESGKKQMDQLALQLSMAGKAIEDGIRTVAQQRLKMAETAADLDRQHDELYEEKRQIQREQRKLGFDQLITDDYEELQRQFRSARAVLMRYDGVKAAVDGGGELIESAEAELAAMTGRQDKELLHRTGIAVLMLTAAVIGVLCVAGAFERPKMENLWFLLLLTALIVAVGQAGSVEMGRGLWYSSLALGINALGMLPLVISKEK